MYSDLTKQDPLSRMKTLCVNYFLLFKTKDVIATEEKDILHDIDSSDFKAVPLSELKRFVKSRSDKVKILSIIAILKIMALRKAVEKQIVIKAGIRRKL